MTFDFIPEFIWIYGSFNPSRTVYDTQYISSATGSSSISIFPMFVIERLTTSYTVGQPIFTGEFGYDNLSYVCYSKKSSDSRTIYWYNPVGAQGNDNGRTYYVLAIGYKEEA